MTMIGGTPDVWISLAAAQRALFQGEDIVTTIVVQGEPEALPAGLVLMTDEQVEDDSLGPMKDAVSSVNSSKYLMWAVAAVIVAALIYVSALQRARDFAVLKAVGASSMSLFLGLAIQAVLVSLAAAALAIAASGFMLPLYKVPVEVPGSAYLLMSELVVRDLTVEYNSGGYPIRPLNQLSIGAADGKLVVVLGPSGCGKTTLLSCLAGLLTPKEGSITLGGTELIGMGPKELADYRRRHVGVVFQAFNLIRDLAEPGRIVVVATHDDRITFIADRVVELVPRESVAEREPEDVVLADGEVLFRQGAPGDLVYVVKSGSVEIYRELSDGGEEQVDVLGPDRYFGELAPLLRLPRSASVRAAGDTVVTGYTLRRFRRDHPARDQGGATARLHVGGGCRTARGRPAPPRRRSAGSNRGEAGRGGPEDRRSPGDPGQPGHRARHGV
jgi:hypothetical protein